MSNTLPSRSAEPMDSMSLSFGLENTHVLITGGSGYIGSAVVSAFLSAGALVTSLDVRPYQLPTGRNSSGRLQHLLCDISSESSLSQSWATAVYAFGPVTTCVALASLDYSVLPHHESIADMSTKQWRNTHTVNVEGTFLTAREWVRGLPHVAAREGEQEHGGNVSLVIVGSESGRFGAMGNADYASGKSAVQVGLVQSLVYDAHKAYAGARVNAVAPGTVDTVQFRRECAQDPTQYYREAEATVPLKKPVSPESVAKTILFLASEWARDITGQVINVDGGKQGKLFWERSKDL